MFKVFGITLRKIVKFLLKAKELIFTLEPVRYFFLLFILLTGFALTSLAQEKGVRTPEGTLPVREDTTQLVTDSLHAETDLPALSDSLQYKSDTTKVAPKGDIETTINYTARDSIRASLDGKMIWLYGNAKITYGAIELEAEEILIDYGNNTLTAHGKRDSLGQRVGYPIFKNGSELYETKDIVYNFKTRRARISEVVTQQGEGFLASEAAFKNEKNEILSLHNSYTTCNLEHPHFRIRATKTKAIPDDKIVAGPFYVEFNDIPLPAGFLFGMFPAQRKSSSGIIFPSYGEEKRRGFNLRGGGYFFDISEYIKLTLTGDIYSKGGHALNASSNYLKRYHYSGNLNFAYSKNPDTDDRIETNSVTQDFRLSWSHSPQSKGTGRFSGSVNAATATFNKNNNMMYGTADDFSSQSLNNITAKLMSNVSYSKRFAGTPFSISTNLSHNQDLLTRVVDLQLPSLSVNMTNIYPFQRKDGGEPGFFDNFSIAYTMSASNRITNNLGRLSPTARQDSIAPFTFDNLSTFIANGRKGMRHSIPVSFSMKAFKHFTLSPSVSYEEKWYAESFEWGYNEVGTLVKTDTIKGFNRIANYSFSTGLTTRLYGMYLVKNPNRKLKAIRHTMNPSISFGYTPDFTKNDNYFQEIPDQNNPGKVIYKSRHDGSLYGGSSASGESSRIGIGLGNNVEMKVKAPEDSIARKVMILNNLSFNTSYDLMADSFNLAPISIAANTNILDNLINMNLSATLDPYAYVTTIDPETGIEDERRESVLVWKNGKIGKITNATLALSTNLNPKARNKENMSREKIAQSDLPEQEKEFLIRNPDAYVDFEIPWSLNLSYNLSYSHPLESKPRVVQTLQMSGDISLSASWKITYASGYHFETKEFTQTNLGISRDLHCWTMRLNWVPFGRFQSYNFTIAVKASILQDLKLERRKPFMDNL
ncbi:MAG TPA: putative LPS assembly protein LptD [Ohtaekwangia sp.]|nr:putative LPS assembly protein LptD [Ohtaekwangia sp.]